MDRQSLMLQLGMLVLLAVVTSTSADDEVLEVCPFNQIYSDCPSCLQKCGEGRPKCNRNCVPGCTCPEGLFLNKKGKCVEECGKKNKDDEDKCPFNQIYSECPSCAQKCGEGRPKCNRNCVPGCTCPEGLFLNKKGKCVEECGKKNKDDEGDDGPSTNLVHVIGGGPIVGGFGEWLAATDEIQSICDQLRDEVETQMNRVTPFTKYLSMTYHSQVVAGKNYDIRIDVGEERHLEISVFESLPLPQSSLSLNSVQWVKTEDETACPQNQMYMECKPCLNTCNGMRKCNRNCMPGCGCPEEAPYQLEDGSCVAYCPVEEAEIGCPLHSCTADMLGCETGRLLRNENGCELCKCSAVPSGDPPGCPMHSCTAEMMECDSGRLKEDENGCVLCECDEAGEEGRGDEVLVVVEDEDPVPSPEEMSCPFNQVYSECKKCDEKCGRRKKCFRNCVAGCTCPEDLPFQTKKGKCVAECPSKNEKEEKKCPFNQKYTECVPCLKVCGKKKEKCNKNCMPGCACPQELPFQTKKGKCIAECPTKKGKGKVPKCPKNQKYSDCATPCPLICGQPRPQICTASCQPGCACPNNKWLREDGKCVKEKKCPK